MITNKYGIVVLAMIYVCRRNDAMLRKFIMIMMLGVVVHVCIRHIRVMGKKLFLLITLRILSFLSSLIKCPRQKRLIEQTKNEVPTDVSCGRKNINTSSNMGSMNEDKYSVPQKTHLRSLHCNTHTLSIPQQIARRPDM